MDTKAIMRPPLAIIALMLLAGCATAGGTLCTAGPIILDKADHLTRATKEQIVTFDESGQRLCGWKAPRR